MDKLPTNKRTGVVFVDNIPSHTTSDQLYHFFKEIDGVSLVQCIDDEGADNYQRCCWIHVFNPTYTVKKINVSTIAGEKPWARLMGYLFEA